MQTFTKLGEMYQVDHGRLVCTDCAGASVKLTGRDISGQRAKRVTARYVEAWKQDCPDLPLRCECRRLTKYQPLSDAEALAAIARALSAPDWSMDTLDEIERILEATGRDIPAPEPERCSECQAFEHTGDECPHGD